jgi:PncC family amidohydrolase
VLGGIVAYSNEIKHRYLNVANETLEQFGAVSAETAYEMAQGARDAFGVDIALSVTGIAGPDGGTESKPVGLTFIGLCTEEGVTVSRKVWSGDREANKTASADAAFQMVRDYLDRTGKSA